MALFETITLVLLGVMWGAQIFSRSLLVWLIPLVWRLGVFIIFGLASYLVYLQFDFWRHDPFGKFFLADAGYFFDYAGTRLLLPWILAYIVAASVGRLSRFLNKKFGERFLEEEEISLFALSTFLVGYPGFLFYFAGMLLIATLTSAIYTALQRGRAPLYYLWLPVAIFVILIKMWFIPHALLTSFVL